METFQHNVKLQFQIHLTDFSRNFEGPVSLPQIGEKVAVQAFAIKVNNFQKVSFFSPFHQIIFEQKYYMTVYIVVIMVKEGIKNLNIKVKVRTF